MVGSSKQLATVKAGLMLRASSVAMNTRSQDLWWLGSIKVLRKKA